MKQKLSVLIIFIIIALFFLPRGLSAWKDRLEIGVSINTAEKFKKDIEDENKKLEGEKKKLKEDPEQADPTQTDSMQADPTVQHNGDNLNAVSGTTGVSETKIAPESY